MANLKLSQVIALEKGAKGKAESAFTKSFHDVQRPGPLSGMSRVYRRRDDESEQLQPENTRLQMRVSDFTVRVSRELSRLIDLTATKDRGNQSARADIVIDDVVIAPDVPVTSLLTLEKKLTDVYTFVSKLPTLDPAEEWEWDGTIRAYRSQPSETVKLKKVPKSYELAPATKEHAAQVQPYTEDVPVGYWSTTKFSGAITETDKEQMLERVVKLQEAVKTAREAANSIEVIDSDLGETVFRYLGW